jgi:hypothetical protein
VPALSLYDLDQLMGMIPQSPLDKAKTQASTWDVRADFAQADTTLPGWLTAPRCPSKQEVIGGTGRGSTAGGIMRQMIDHLRAQHAAAPAAADS